MAGRIRLATPAIGSAARERGGKWPEVNGDGLTLHNVALRYDPADGHAHSRRREGRESRPNNC